MSCFTKNDVPEQIIKPLLIMNISEALYALAYMYTRHAKKCILIAQYFRRRNLFPLVRPQNFP